MNNLAPIALFVYNRPDYTVQTIQTLIKNPLALESDLFIFSDYAKSEKQIPKVQEVRRIINNLKGFKSITVIEAKSNKGLANSIIQGVTQIVNKYGKIIVLEDDIISSPMFLNYMNDALDFYKDYHKIWSISGYRFPLVIPDEYEESIYYGYRSSSWGWATWQDRWNTIDWDIKDYKNYLMNPFKIYKFCRGGNDLDKMLRYQMKGRIDSWAVRWCYNQAMQDKFTVYPVKTLVSNLGTDGSGTHCDSSSKRFNMELSDDYEYQFNTNIKIDTHIARNFRKVVNRSIIRKIKNTIKK